MISKTNNYSQSFEGIYKIKYTPDNRINKFLEYSEFIIKKSKPFEQNGDQFCYAVTTDNMTSEAIFENELKHKKISFWKSLPLNKIINKEMIDNIFKINKEITGKENWT